MMSSVKVAVRIRPINKREKALNSDVVVKVSGNAVFVITNKLLDSSLSDSISSKDKYKQFTFDHSYSSVDPSAEEYADQEKIYKDLGTSVVSSCIEGYNACIFAYGQTGSGKSYTMMGGDLSCYNADVLTSIKPSLKSQNNGFNVQNISHTLPVSKSNHSLVVSGKSGEFNIYNGDKQRFTPVKVVPSNSQLSINDLQLTVEDDNIKQHSSHIDKTMENGLIKKPQTIINGNRLSLNDPGLTPRVCESIIEKMNSTDCTYKLQVSYMEIYNERVRDLLKNNNGLNLKVREHPKEGPYVQNLSRHTVTSYSDIQQLLNIGNKHRTTASTLMNQQSSRSHALFTLYLNQAKLSDDLPSELSSKVHLVDLAGSERAESSGCRGERLKEGGSINKSLVTLGGVICALAEQSSSRFIPYRNSTLTWVLKDSLGGNSLTLMIATISPAEACVSETMSTLRYASRSKKIINTPHVNQDANVKLIRELKEENAKLKQLLATAQESSPQVLETTHKLYDNEYKVQELLDAWAQKWQHIFCELKQDKETSQNTKMPLLVCLLDCVNPLNSVRMYPINQGDTVIGSETDECKPDITLLGLDSPHCVITLHDDIGTLKACGGSSCLIDSAVPESSQALLHHGSMIQLGGRYLLRFNMPRDVIMSSRATNSSMNDSAIDVCASLKNSMEGSRTLKEFSRSFGDFLHANTTIDNYLESSRSLSDVLEPALKVPAIETSRSVGSCMDASRYVNNGVQASNNEMAHLEGSRRINNKVKASRDIINRFNKKYADCFNISMNNINNKNNTKLTRRSNSVGDVEENTISERQLEMLKLERERQLEGWIELMKESDNEFKHKETEKAWFKREIDNLKHFVHKNMLLLHSNIRLNNEEDEDDDIGYDNDLGGFKNSNKSIYDGINLEAYDYSLSGLCLHCDDNGCPACSNYIDTTNNSLRGCFSSASLSSPRYLLDGGKGRKASHSKLNLGSLDRMNMKKKKNKFINQSMSLCARSLFSDCSKEQPISEKHHKTDAIYMPNDEDLARVDIKELSNRLTDGSEFIDNNINSNDNNNINKQISLLETRTSNIFFLFNYLLKKVSCYHAISTALKTILDACGTLQPSASRGGACRGGGSIGIDENQTLYDDDYVNSLDAGFTECTSCDINCRDADLQSQNDVDYDGCKGDDGSVCIIDGGIGDLVDKGLIEDNNNNANNNDNYVLMTTVLRMLQEKMVEVKVRCHMIQQILTSKDPIIDFQSIVIRCNNNETMDSVDNEGPKNIVFCSSFNDDADMITTACTDSGSITTHNDNKTTDSIVNNNNVYNDESVYKRLEELERRSRLSDELINYIKMHIQVQQYIKMHKQQNTVPKKSQTNENQKQQQQPSNQQLLTAATIKYKTLAASAAEAKLLLTGTDNNQLALSLRTETCILREIMTFDLNNHWCDLIKWTSGRPIISQASPTATISLDVTNALNQSTLFIDVCSALHSMNSLDQHLTTFSTKLMDLLHKGVNDGFVFKNNVVLVNNNNDNVPNNNNNNINGDIHPLELIGQLEKLMRLIWCVFNLKLSSSSSSSLHFSMVGRIGETVVPKLFEMLCHRSFVPYIHQIYSSIDQSAHSSTNSSTNPSNHPSSCPQCSLKSIKQSLSTNSSPWINSCNLFKTSIHFQSILQSLSFIHSTHPSIFSSINHSMYKVANCRHKVYLKCFNEIVYLYNKNNIKVNKCTDNYGDNSITEKHCVKVTENHPLGLYDQDDNISNNISINSINNNNNNSNKTLNNGDTNNSNEDFNIDNNRLNIQINNDNDNNTHNYNNINNNNDNTKSADNMNNNDDDIERYVLKYDAAGPHSLISCEASKLVALLYFILQETLSCGSFTVGDNNFLAALLFKYLAVVAAKCCNYVVYKDDGGDNTGTKNNITSDSTYSYKEEDKNIVSEDDEDEEEEEEDDDDVQTKRIFKDIKSELMTPFEAALHFNDCKFLSRHLKRICYLFNNNKNNKGNNNNKNNNNARALNNIISKAPISSHTKLPTSSSLVTTQALTIVKGSLSLLRHKSSSPLQYTIKIHIQAAIATLELADWNGISDNCGVACFRVVTQFFEYVNKKIVYEWKGVLSDKIYHKSLGVIITCWMEGLVERLLRVAEFNQEDCTVLCEVLDVVIRNAPDFFNSPDFSEYRVQMLTMANVKSWLKFKETRSLFGSNLIEISDRWASGLGPLALHFSANQVAQMVRAIFENTNKRESVLKDLLRHPSIHHP